MNKSFNVVNFHLTEKCNYRCLYCYAKFHDVSELELDEWKKAVDMVKKYFVKNDIQGGRINLAGGEPLLVKFIDDLIDYIYSCGIKVSIITNGSLLTQDHISRWAHRVDMIGISIDSMNTETNLSIGRHQQGKTLDLKRIVSYLNSAKLNGIKIKVNTVVSKLNINENVSDLYEMLSFDRIKVMQMRINKDCNESSKELTISKDEFRHYVNQINHIHDLVVEPEEEIDSSYVIIDPQGYLISNKNNIHQKVGLIFDDTLDHLITKAELNVETFMKRYKNTSQEDNHELT